MMFVKKKNQKLAKKNFNELHHFYKKNHDIPTKSLKVSCHLICFRNFYFELLMAFMNFGD